MVIIIIVVGSQLGTSSSLRLQNPFRAKNLLESSSEFQVENAVENRIERRIDIAKPDER